MIQAGERAPGFSAPDQSGREVSLDDLLADGPVTLFFYPKAFTPGCTAESCHFRDLAAEFAAVGATRVGVSADAVAKQGKFDEKHGLGFPLLSDPQRAIAAAYGVKRPGPVFNKRATFVIGRDGIVLGTISSEIRTDRHADEALALLRAAEGAA